MKHAFSMTGDSARVDQVLACVHEVCVVHALPILIDTLMPWLQQQWCFLLGFYLTTSFVDSDRYTYQFSQKNQQKLHNLIQDWHSHS